jgi:hypothetical protein
METFDPGKGTIDCLEGRSVYELFNRARARKPLGPVHRYNAGPPQQLRQRSDRATLLPRDRGAATSQAMSLLSRPDRGRADRLPRPETAESIK